MFMAECTYFNSLPVLYKVKLYLSKSEDIELKCYFGKSESHSYKYLSNSLKVSDINCTFLSNL